MDVYEGRYVSFAYVVYVCHLYLSFAYVVYAVIYDGQEDFVYDCHLHLSFAYVVYVVIYDGQEEGEAGFLLKSNNPTLTGGEKHPLGPGKQQHTQNTHFC